jgi:hypothetical protein
MLPRRVTAPVGPVRPGGPAAVAVRAGMAREPPVRHPWHESRGGAHLLSAGCWTGLVRVAYERLAEPHDLLRRARELSARTIILDVEPLVAYWDSGQASLDAGIARVLSQIAADPGVRVVCFSTNSQRSPSTVVGTGASRAGASGGGASGGGASGGGASGGGAAGGGEAGGGRSGDRGPRVVYLASAGKPLRISPYRAFPRPGVVIGDQVATDGILARRLGYTFLHYCPDLTHAPAGPRLMNELGRPLHLLLFTRHG